MCSHGSIDFLYIMRVYSGKAGMCGIYNYISPMGDFAERSCFIACSDSYHFYNST
jgi:hypothetical protein